MVREGGASGGRKGQQWMTAVALLREMQHWQTETNVITYSATISACEKGQQRIIGLALLQELQK